MSDPSVLSSDGDLVAVLKPTGWVVHAAMEGERFDLRAWLSAQPGVPKGLEPCHRLDRETSGVVLYAASILTRGNIGRFFMDGTVTKTYLALVQGHAHKKGVIRVPLAPDDGGPPQEAITRYRLQEGLGAFSLLRVTPETGRKHQIRRHLHGLGLSIVGDDRYVPKHKLRIPAFPNRMFLHAAKLELPDGRVFEAPLPPELERCVVALRSRPERPKVEGDPF